MVGPALFLAVVAGVAQRDREVDVTTSVASPVRTA
jgi:hypothetical protein